MHMQYKLFKTKDKIKVLYEEMKGKRQDYKSMLTFKHSNCYFWNVHFY